MSQSSTRIVIDPEAFTWAERQVIMARVHNIITHDPIPHFDVREMARLMFWAWAVMHGSHCASEWVQS